MGKLNDINNFSVVFLSAGTGSRLGALGKAIPKSLIKIKNETLLYRLVKFFLKKKLRELNIIVGYKHKMIFNELKAIKNIKINYIYSKNFISNGSCYSWYLFKKYWEIKKKPILMFHTDLIFDEKFADNIIYSKIKNIIGIRLSKKNKLKKNSFVVRVNKKRMFAKEIGLKKNVKSFYGEVICINKFSIEVMNKIFNYMKIYFKNYGKSSTWEFMLNNFINDYKKIKINVLKDQNFKWVNINSPKDLTYAKKLF